MVHQPTRFFNLIEIDEDALESVFFFLKENRYSVLIEQTKKTLYRDLPDLTNKWILLPFVTEAPTQIVKRVETATIEKILVDIFCDEITFFAQQGHEMKVIFQQAFSKYAVQESTILRYADRRGKKKEIDNFLNKVSKFRQ